VVRSENIFLSLIFLFPWFADRKMWERKILSRCGGD
jgi:hypothetical protein